MATRIRNEALTIAAATVALLVVATAAVASTTISIKSSQVPVQASQFAEHDDCAFPGQPSQSPPMWGWHFVLPGGEATFVSLTAHFATAGDVTLPGSSGAFVQDGKGAVLYTATDDTLTGAEATIEGTTPQGYFVLSHTCLPTPSPTPTPSASVSATATASSSPSLSVSPSASVSATSTATTSTPSAEVSGVVLTNSPSPSITPNVKGVKLTQGAVAGTALPSTGFSALGLLVLAGLLTATGLVLAATRPKGRHARC